MGRIRLFPLLFQNGCSQSSCFPTAGQGERRLWERDWSHCNHPFLLLVYYYTYFFFKPSGPLGQCLTPVSEASKEMKSTCISTLLYMGYTYLSISLLPSSIKFNCWYPFIQLGHCGSSTQLYVTDQGQVVRKPVNVNPELNINGCIILLV